MTCSLALATHVGVCYSYTDLSLKKLIPELPHDGNSIVHKTQAPTHCEEAKALGQHRQLIGVQVLFFYWRLITEMKRAR